MINKKELKELNSFLHREIKDTVYAKSENEMFIIDNGVLKVSYVE